MTCRMCPAITSRDLCHFCARTVDLVKADRCVSCCTDITRTFDQRTEGLCADCRSRSVHLGPATRHLLILASRARYRARLAA